MTSRELTMQFELLKLAPEFQLCNRIDKRAKQIAKDIKAKGHQRTDNVPFYDLSAAKAIYGQAMIDVGTELLIELPTQEGANTETPYKVEGTIPPRPKRGRPVQKNTTDTPQEKPETTDTPEPESNKDPIIEDVDIVEETATQPPNSDIVATRRRMMDNSKQHANKEINLDQLAADGEEPTEDNPIKLPRQKRTLPE